MSIQISAFGYHSLGSPSCSATTFEVPDGTDWEQWKKSKDVREVTLVNLKEFDARYTGFYRGQSLLFVTEAV